jgi:hypothetical protein
MPNYRGMIPQIKWGPTFTNIIVIGYPLDDPLAYEDPREGSDFVQGSSGVEDAWVQGEDQILEGVLRWIPRVVATNPAATGYEDANGVRDWISDARKKNIFRWYPDIGGNPTVFYNMYLVDPMTGGIEKEADGRRRVKIKMRTSDGASVDGY